MAYCKHCGMDSSNDAKCQWCGRDIAPARQIPKAAPPPAMDNSAEARLARMDERERLGRSRFFVGVGILLVAASVAILLRYQIYPWIILAASFATGYLLRRFEVVEPYADDLLLIGLLFIIPAPMFFVLLGLIAYGVIQKDLNYTFVWLIGAFLVVQMVLVVVTTLALPKTVPWSLVMPILGLDKLGFLAVVAGWRSAGTY